MKVDASCSSCVAVCSCCGARFLTAPGKVNGWRVLAAHERHAHPGSLVASKRLSDAARLDAL